MILIEKLNKVYKYNASTNNRVVNSKPFIQY